VAKGVIQSEGGKKGRLSSHPVPVRAGGQHHGRQTLNGSRSAVHIAPPHATGGGGTFFTRSCIHVSGHREILWRVGPHPPHQGAGNRVRGGVPSI